MRTTVSKRGVRGGKRPDTNQMKEWLAKGQQVTCLGIVRKFPGETSHFEIHQEDERVEVLVDVELSPSQTRIMCRLGFGNDKIFKIPRVDTEVAVLIPYDPQSLIKDPLDYEGIIVGVLDVAIPAELADDDTTLVYASNIKIGDNTASPLATKADIDALISTVNTLITAYNSHVHTGVTTGAGSSGPTASTASSAANSTGTQKTKAT